MQGFIKLFLVNFQEVIDNGVVLFFIFLLSYGEIKLQVSKSVINCVYGNDMVIVEVLVCSKLILKYICFKNIKKNCKYLSCFFQLIVKISVIRG